MDPAMNHHDQIARRIPPARHPPLVLQAVRRRPRRDRAGPAARRQAAPAARRRPTRSPPKLPHFAPKAKRVIYLFMAGAPSHLELFDNKPELAKCDGKLPPAELLKGYRAAFINPNSKLLGPEVQVRPARPERRGALGAAAAPRRGGRRHRDRQVDAHRRVQPRAGADPDEHRLAAVRPAEHGRVGHLRPGQRVAATCPASSSSAPAPRAPAAARRTGAAASCPRSTRASCSAPAAIRCCTSPTRRASTRSSSATRSTPSAA